MLMIRHGSLLLFISEIIESQAENTDLGFAVDPTGTQMIHDTYHTMTILMVQFCFGSADSIYDNPQHSSGVTNSDHHCRLAILL